MHFCTKCDNMYYIKLFGDDKTQLSYYCKKCGNEDTSSTNIIVSKVDIKKKNDKDFSYLVNKYTKLDPTLPRKNNVKCPNVKCVSNLQSEDGGKVENEVLFIRYDDINMKYIYMCCNCDTVWNNS